jgi:putative methyltransferase (TIGR01177 family)
MRAFVELSGESPPLAAAELAACLTVLGSERPRPGAFLPGLVEVDLRDEARGAELARRLALARRVLVPVEPIGSVEEAARVAGAARLSTEIRRLGSPGQGADATVRAVGAAYVRGGGTIDLDAPEMRLWLAATAEGTPVLLRELARVGREEFTARAMPRLPFRRPISLPPRLARAAVNLACVRPGDRVLDPFLGTGALLAEAALLGARTFGIDRDAAMVRGALENFRHLGVEAVQLVQGDARDPSLSFDRPFDAIVTDPPYGRSSGAGGESPAPLARAVLDRWQGAVRPGGRIVVVTPFEEPLLAAPWREEERIGVRVHRSLTRRFSVYARASG